MKIKLLTGAVAAWAVLIILAPGIIAQEKKAQNAAMGEDRWSGVIVRSNKDTSTLTVSRHGVEKFVHYDSSTKWTQGTKVIDSSEVKDGARVICVGKFDEKGALNATRIDLRTP
jgi:hypothetical protein